MLKAGHEKSKEMYEKKRSGNGQEATLFSLAWDVLGYETLLKENVEFQNKIAGMQLLIQNSTINISAKLHQLTREITSYSKGVYAKQRMAATHIFVFMISEEQRNQKPYAIPVRFFSYHSVTDKRIGELKKEIVEAMKKLQMLPIGFVTDGEFNSLRTAGSERPISIVQLIMDSRNEAKKINSNTIAKYLRPILRQGNIGPEQVHPAVPIADVQWLQDFMTTNNVTFEAAYCPFLHGFVSLYFF